MPTEIRGQFVTLACSLLETKPEVKAEALNVVNKLTGMSYDKLDPMGWYPVTAFSGVFESLTQKTSTILARAAMKTIGKKVYPTIKAHGGIPAGTDTPLALLKFEAQGFLNAFRGPGVVPRKIVKEAPKDFVVQADMPSGIPPELMEGVYLGILEMCGLKGGVRVEESGGHYVYHVTWS